MNLSVQEISNQLNLLRKGWGRSTKETGREIVHWWDRIPSVREVERLELGLTSWQRDEVAGSKASILEFQTEEGRVTLLRPPMRDERLAKGHRGQFVGTDYALARERIGEVLRKKLSAEGGNIELVGHNCSNGSWLGGLVALDLAGYSFRRVSAGKGWPGVRVHFRDDKKAVAQDIVLEAQRRAAATNWARHLVNLPPNVINPESMARALMRSLPKDPRLTVELWDWKRLREEGMGLHWGVGQASDHPPFLLKAHYRPKGRKSMHPIAFVGKGITFDSGGLNLKPASNMRWMKKDMGGAAAVAGLILYAVESGLSQPLDFYLALAENAVSGDAFCPGDILTSRSGKLVEIHNTDAEGRLVLADALDVAVTAKERPQLVIDVATLTGAIKAGLGSSVAGLFASDDRVLAKLEAAMNGVGDWVWPMPLVPRYRGQLESTVADLVNASDGFGGAITAAMFLQEFVRDIPWAHLDIYAWKDSAEGPIREQGASGQAVEGLIQFLHEHKQASQTRAKRGKER